MLSELQLLNDFFLILPEISLSITALLFQLCVIFTKKYKKLLAYLAIIIVMIITYYTFYYRNELVGSILGNSYINNDFNINIKVIVMLFSLISLLANIIFKNSFKGQSESFSLMIFATIGVLIAISANHFLTLYLGMELQSLCLYVLVSLNTKDINSSEAGIKYFILSALASCVGLYGISLIYGFSGSFNFTALHDFYSSGEVPVVVAVGAIMFLSTIMFKLSVVPFHSWTPDVYQGAPIATLIFLASASKVGFVYILFNMSILLFKIVIPDFEVIIRIMAIISLAVGAFGAIKQTSLRRILGYSSILNIGYILILLVNSSNQSLYKALLFIIIYSCSVVLLLSRLQNISPDKNEDIKIDDLTSLASSNKLSALLLMILLFSLIGIPPLPGFIAKFLILQSAINSGEYVLSVAAVSAASIAAFYYLRIIKIMYFDDSKLKQEGS